MNEETLILLSDYLDGAMAPADRAAFETRLAASPELRRELEELRAVSRSIKDLPRQPLPAHFMARLQARRARGEKPQANWVFLPPSLRPVALALSCGVVALVIWDKVAVAPPDELIHPQYAAKISAAGDAPTSQFDVSKRAAGEAGAGGGSSNGFVDGRATGVAGAEPEERRRGDVIPQLAERDQKAAVPLDSSAAPAAANEMAAAPAAKSAPGAAGSIAAARGSARAKAAGRPLESLGALGGKELALTDRTRQAMTEEERSAKNEQMFGYIEQEKKKMGIAQVLPRRDPLVGRTEALTGGAAPAAPAIAAAAPSMLKRAQKDGPAADKLSESSDAATLQAAHGAAAPAAKPAASAEASRKGRLSNDAGLVFTDASSLRSSWVLLGFPGAPPMADFTSGRLVLIKPSATKIVSVTTEPGSVNVVYRTLDQDEDSDPARDRVAPIPSEPRTVLFFDASPR